MPRGGQAYEPSISADGSVVAFTYRPPAGLAATPVSVLVWDRASGQTLVVSHPADRAELDRSREPAVSGDGRYVAFTSDDVSLVPNDGNGAQDVFRYDRRSGSVDLVSVALKGGSAPNGSYGPSISGDGSRVAFTSLGGSYLVPMGLSELAQVFVRDMSAGTTSLVSVAADGSAPSATSGQTSISDDGQFVAFSSQASNLVAGFSPAQTAPVEVFRRDLAQGVTVLVSAQGDGSPNPAASALPSISRDGRMVAYATIGTFVPGTIAERRTTTILLRDVTAGATVLITVNLSGSPSQSYSLGPRVAGLGRYVAFASTGADLVAGDTNQLGDVFIRDMPPLPRLNPPTVDFGTFAVGAAPSNAAAVLMNAGWGPMTMKPATVSGSNAGDYSVLADGCSAATLYSGEACTVTVGFGPTQPGTRTAQLQIPVNAPGSPAVQQLTGRGSQARITLDPPIGPQGIVVVATGDHFPANSQVQLSWSVGITPGLPVVKADASGHWQIQVLVFHHDIVGPRNLVATSVGGPAFPTVAVPMLVTVRSVGPPGFGNGGSPNGPLTLLFRG